MVTKKQFVKLIDAIMDTESPVIPLGDEHSAFKHNQATIQVWIEMFQDYYKSDNVTNNLLKQDIAKEILTMIDTAKALLDGKGLIAHPVMTGVAEQI
jgi:hypothetical protein